MSLPTELDAVYRSRGSFESEEEVGRYGRSRGYSYAYNSGSGLRDVDGFGYDMKPVMPRGIMGDKF